MKLRVSEGPPNYRQPLPHRILFWHGCQTRQVDPSTILLLVETNTAAACACEVLWEFSVRMNCLAGLQRR